MTKKRQEKFCKNNACPGGGERRATAAGFCRACYMKQYRATKENQPSHETVQGDPSLTAFVSRQLPALRKAAIRRLLDHGLGDVEVYEAFSTRPDLQRFTEGLSNVVVAIKRDLASIRRDDQGKPPLILDNERAVRLAQEQLMTHMPRWRHVRRRYAPCKRLRTFSAWRETRCSASLALA